MTHKDATDSQIDLQGAAKLIRSAMIREPDKNIQVELYGMIYRLFALECHYETIRANGDPADAPRATLTEAPYGPPKHDGRSRMESEVRSWEDQ
ncbi:MAG: hypothetical protein VW405_10960 [Rhodospirillaceae bacterium]